MNAKLLLGIIACLFFFACSQKNSQNGSLSDSANTSLESITTDSVNNDRVIIKSAEINLYVDKVENEIQQFQEKINSLDGHIFHYEINNNSYIEKEFQKNMDSTYQVYKIDPIGSMKVKVPIKNTDEFVKYVLAKNGIIEHFMLDEEDVTEDIQEKKELATMDVNMSVPKQSIASNYYDKETKEEKIIRKAVFNKLAYKTKFIWFDISLHGTSFIDKKLIASSKVYRTPFYISFLKSLQNGWYYFSDFIVGIVNIWPFILIGIVVFYLIKKYKKIKTKFLKIA